MTKIKYFKNSVWAYALFVLTIVIPYGTTAQSPQLLTPVTAGGITFERYRLTTDAAISYCNVKYVEAEIKANYPRIKWETGEKLSIRIATHDLFVQAVKESFIPERFAFLVGREEELGLHFMFSHTGKLLRLAFILKSDSQINPTELAALEHNLVRQLTFHPYDVSLSGPAAMSISIYFKMSEVKAGEVKEVRFYSK